MARLARVVAPGLPHHVTQRGNRRQETFFTEDDYRAYKALLAEHCAAQEVAVWGYCLMPNHVHLILAPATAKGLARAVGEAHRRYTRRINLRQGWRGYLWQGRFASVVLDEKHLLAAARYVALNPVRAGLVERPEDWPWSSARAQLAGRGDGLVEVAPLAALVPDWPTFLAGGLRPAELKRIRAHERTGRPLGDGRFLADLEVQLGRRLSKRTPGRKPKAGPEPGN